MNPFLLLVFRNVLQLASGYLVAKGTLSADSAQAAATSVEAIAGAAGSLVALGMSVKNQKNKSK